MKYNTRNWEGVSLGGVAPTPNAFPMLPGESVDAYTVRYMAHTKRKNQLKAQVYAAADAAMAPAIPLNESAILDECRSYLAAIFGVSESSEPARPRPVLPPGVTWAWLPGETPESVNAKISEAFSEYRKSPLGYIVTNVEFVADSPTDRTRVDYAAEREATGTIEKHAEPTQAERRREIGAMLADDARTTPAFATARKAAVLAAAESFPDITAADAHGVLRCATVYEEKRGVLTRPSDAATNWRAGLKSYGSSTAEHSAALDAGLAAYERARGMK